MRSDPVRGGRGATRMLAAAAVIAGLAASAVPAIAPAATHAAAAGGHAGHAAALDIAQDVLVDRVFVPSAAHPQGEVRIVRRGGHAVVQTLLYTRVLKRVFGAVADKERRNWPEGAAGYDDMKRYLAALEEFRRAAAARPDQAGVEVDRRVRVLIEFIDAPAAPLVAVGGVEIDGAGEAIRIVSRPAPDVLELSLGYVRRNMQLIVADAFHLPVPEAAARIARAGTP